MPLCCETSTSCGRLLLRRTDSCLRQHHHARRRACPLDGASHQHAGGERLRTIRELSDAGIPTQSMLGPVIPGLNHSEIPAILPAARDAGADEAGYVLSEAANLGPRSVSRLAPANNCLPRRRRVRVLICAMRNGRLHDSQFGRRQRGAGNFADLIADTFALWRKRLRYPEKSEPLLSRTRLPTAVAYHRATPAVLRTADASFDVRDSIRKSPKLSR